ncbi:MAG: hypothetical protein OHK0046_51950 [Anaerolineae bacterium]
MTQNPAGAFRTDFEAYVTHKSGQAIRAAGVAWQPVRELLNKGLLWTSRIGAAKATHTQLQACIVTDTG